jgi:hypothetical protein
MIPNQKPASPKFNMPVLVAEHTLTVWCDQCQKDRMLVIAGENFQTAWCLNCRGVLSQVGPSRESGGIYDIRTRIRGWAHLGDKLLIHTTGGLIPIQVGSADIQRMSTDLSTNN